MGKFKSLRMEIAIVIAIFVVISLVASTTFISNNVKKMVLNSEEQIKIEGEKISNEFSDILVENSLKNSEQQVETTQDAIKNYFEIPELALSIILNDDNAKGVMGANPEPAVSALKKNLTNVRKQSEKAVMFLYVGYKDKQTYTATGWETPDYDPTSRPWYKEAVEAQGETIWTEPYIDFATGKLVITVAHSLEDDNGELIGVAAADVSLSSLQEMINGYKVGETGYIIATDKNGIVLNHPEDIGVTNPDEYKNVGKKMPIPELLSYVDSSNSNLERIDYEYNGNNKISVAHKVPGTGIVIFATFEEKDVLSLADESRESFKEFRSRLQNEMQNEQKQTINQIIFLAIGLIIILAGIGYIYSNKISKPIVSLTKDMNTLSNGDFKSKIKTKANSKELLLAVNSLKDLRESIGQIVIDVIDLADEIHDSTQELQHSGKELSQSSKSVTAAVNEIANGATEQANDSEESARSMKKLSEIIKNVIDFNKVQIDQTSTMSESNEKGLNAVSDLDTKTNETTAILRETNKKTSELASVIGQITGITEAINSIAEQTNLLALNASIEAARAGEAGKGFAVVADEIRKLAEETSDSTEKIGEMISKIEETSDEVVSAMNSLENISEEQVSASNNVISEFDEIKAGLEEMINMIDSSSEKVLEIDSRKTDVMNKIENIVAVTEETAAASEEVNASIDHQDESIQAVLDLAISLSDKAERLNENLKKFEI